MTNEVKVIKLAGSNHYECLGKEYQIVKNELGHYDIEVFSNEFKRWQVGETCRTLKEAKESIVPTALYYENR